MPHRYFSILPLRLLGGGCRLLLALVLLGLFPASRLQAAEESPEALFTEMQAAFERADYSHSHALGEKLLKAGHLSPELFQLLGHTEYRRGELGQAALAYKRALLFPPPVPEVRQNLTHIQDKTGNLLFPRNGLQELYASWFDRTRWMGIAVSACWVSLISLVLLVVRRPAPPVRALLATVSAAGVFVSVLALIGWSWRPSYSALQDLAVITEPHAKAYTAATITAGSVSALPPGSEVRKLEERGSWTYVEIPGEDQNRRGWVTNSALASLWPFDPGYLE